MVNFNGLWLKASTLKGRQTFKRSANDIESVHKLLTTFITAQSKLMIVEKAISN